MTLRGHVVEQEARLPDGRTAAIGIGVREDSYVERREPEAVALELAREVAAGRRSGEVEPTAGALEPLANRFPAT